MWNLFCILEALLITFAFILIFIWVFRPGSKEQYEKTGRIIFKGKKS